MEHNNEVGTADSVAAFRSSPRCASGEIFWLQVKNMFKYGLLFDMASEHSRFQ